jgi:ribosomal protein S18 acetylase RimI-like enzyme
MTLTNISTEQIIIRKLQREDLPKLEWEGELIHFRRIYAQAYAQYRSGDAVLWVAEDPEQFIVAQVFIQLTSHRQELANGNQRAYLYGFRVRENYRSQGIGTRMLKIVEADLLKRGYTSITLNVGRDNPDARRLYERHGFHVVAPEPGRWSYLNHLGEKVEVNEPAWRMEKTLL